MVTLDWHFYTIIPILFLKTLGYLGGGGNNYEWWAKRPLKILPSYTYNNFCKKKFIFTPHINVFLEQRFHVYCCSVQNLLYSRTN